MKIIDGWLVFATLGEMNVKNVVDECQKEGWAPVLIFRDSESSILPVLDTQEKAIRFAQRNLPKGQVFGTIILTELDAERIEKQFSSKGIEIEFLNHPKRMKGRTDVEIYEFAKKPDVYGAGKNMVTRPISFAPK